jgi:hypothetical protein
MFVCPVCAYSKLRHAPVDFTICPSCGTEFGYHDSTKTYSDLRTEWIMLGMRWHSRAIPQPADWNPVANLINQGYWPVRDTSSSGLSEQEERNTDDVTAAAYSFM